MENQLFELMTKMYSQMEDIRTDVADIKTDVGVLKTDVGVLKTDVADLKVKVSKIEVAIEHDIQPKITVLFDGYKQNTEQLTRISEEVAKHEEVIIRRIK